MSSVHRLSSKERRALAKELESFDRSIFIAFDPVLPDKELPVNSIGDWLSDHAGAWNSEDFFLQVLMNIPIETAVKAWLETIPNVETRNKYNRNMKRVFSIPVLSDLIDKRCAITTLDKNWAGTDCVYMLINDLEVSESSKKICQSVYERFCDYIKTITLGTVVPEESPERKLEYREAEIIFGDIEWSQFMKALRPPYDLLAEMTWLAAESCEVRLRLVTSQKNILKLHTNQLDFKNNAILYDDSQIYNPIGFAHQRLRIGYPEEFMARMKERINGRNGHVFLTQKGKQSSSIQVQREFRRASAKLQHDITPVLFGWAAVISGRKSY